LLSELVPAFDPILSISLPFYFADVHYLIQGRVLHFPGYCLSGKLLKPYAGENTTYFSGIKFLKGENVLEISHQTQFFELFDTCDCG
jgi:hypothetical protein